MQTQSISKHDLDVQLTSTFDQANQNAAESSSARNVHLKSKIARLTTIYSNPSLKKPPALKKDIFDISESGLPSDYRLLGDSIISSVTSAKAANAQKFKGVIPPSLRLGKVFMQNQQPFQPVTPQNVASGCGFINHHTVEQQHNMKAKGTLSKDSLVLRNEEEDSNETNSTKSTQKLRRVAESCSRSTASNSTSKQQDSIKGLSNSNGNNNAKDSKVISHKFADKRLVEVIERVKGVIEEYKKREEALVKHNKALKEELAVLKKAVECTGTGSVLNKKEK